MRHVICNANLAQGALIAHKVRVRNVIRKDGRKIASEAYIPSKDA
jgi:hypothetical protein